MKSVSAIVEVRSGISLPSTPWEVSLPVALSFDIIFFHVPQGSESFNHFMNSALLQYVGKSCSRNVFFKMTIVNFSLSDIPLERTSSLSLSLSLSLFLSLSLSPLFFISAEQLDLLCSNCASNTRPSVASVHAHSDFHKRTQR